MRDQNSNSASGATKNAEEDARGPGVREPLTRAESEYARELFELHQLSLYRYLNRLLHSREEAREILQETYLRLLRQPSLDHVRQNARAYLFQTATNLARDRFRQKALQGLESEMEDFAAGGCPNWMTWPELALEAEQLAEVVVAALNEMDRSVRTALLLQRFRSLTHGEIARRLGVSERTVERYIKEGVNVIAKRLKGKL